MMINPHNYVWQLGNIFNDPCLKDICTELFSYLQPKDLGVLSLVSKSLEEKMTVQQHLLLKNELKDAFNSIENNYMKFETELMSDAANGENDFTNSEKAAKSITTISDQFQALLMIAIAQGKTDFSELTEEAKSIGDEGLRCQAFLQIIKAQAKINTATAKETLQLITSADYQTEALVAIAIAEGKSNFSELKSCQINK